MSTIRLSNLGYAFDGGPDLFSDISCHLDEGWTGLVGPNGAGKTTLFDVIRGARTPTRGSVQLEPGNAPVAWCPQRVETLDGQITDFASEWTSEAMRWKSLLELEPTAIHRWETLSPGRRKRWQLGASLYDDPLVALLDEPTNHLDRPGRELLVEALVQFDGTGLVVAHDRSFLDELCDETLWLSQGTATLYAGGYTEAKRQRDAWMAEQRAKMESLRDEQRRLKDELVERRRQANEADKSYSREAKRADLGDSDARSMGRKGRAQRAAASLSRAASQSRSRLEHIEDQLEELSYVANYGRDIELDDGEARNSTVVRWNADEVRRGETVVFERVGVTFDRSDRVWLDAPNGAGKTTFLEEFLDHANVPNEHLLYLPQQMGMERACELLEETRQLPNDQLGRVMQGVAHLGVDPDKLLRSERPSPGEARKLLVARGLCRETRLAVLDEPTNHLDIASIERLEEALTAYDGPLLLVTHDVRFAKAIADRRWTIEARELQRCGPVESD